MFGAEEILQRPVVKFHKKITFLGYAVGRMHCLAKSARSKQLHY